MCFKNIEEFFKVATAKVVKNLTKKIRQKACLPNRPLSLKEKKKKI